MKQYLIIIIAFIALSASGQGIGAWQLETAPTGQHYLIFSDKITGVFDTIPADRLISDSLGYSRIDSIKCVSDTIRIYTNNGQFKMPFSCSGGGGGGGVADSLYIKTTSISDAVTTYKIMLDNGVTQDSIIIEDGHPQLTVTTLTLGDVTTYYIKQDGVTKGTIVVDNSPGGGAGIDSVRCVNDSLRIYSGASVFKTAIDCANDNEIQDLVPYVISGDTIGLIITKPNPLLQDTLLFDYGELASNPYNLIPYVSGGDTIGAILTGLNATSNDTLIFDSGDADFWQNVVLGSDNSTTTTDYPFTFTPNDNTRYKIRVEALLYSSDPGVGVRPVFLIDGTLTGYSDFSVNIVAPNGENSNIVVYGGYNDPSWIANTTGSTSYTMTAIFEITLITTTAPADVKIGFASETGASVTMKKGSLFSYKTY